MRFFFLAVFTVCLLQAYSQEFNFKLTEDGFPEKLKEGVKVPLKEKKIFLQEPSDNGKKYYLLLKTGVELEFTSSDESKFIPLTLENADPRIKPKILNEEKETLITFEFTAEEDVTDDDPDGDNSQKNGPTETAQDIFNSLFNVTAKPYGLIVNSGETKFKGPTYVHIFLDQYGSLLNSTVPQGVSEKQYVVHVLYVAPVNNREIFYSVRENKSSFNPALRFNNEDFRKIIGGSTLGIGAKNKPTLDWYHQEILLSTSTTDIEFELFLIAVKKTNIYDFEKKSLSKYTIKMSPTYHGTFDVGLIYSNLENPNYELVTSPVDNTKNVAKRTNLGRRGIITAMATFYTSPVVLIEKFLMKKEIPEYKLYGRNMLDDHAWYERIYPTIGIGFTDKTFENLFYGFNWGVCKRRFFFRRLAPG
ncbi:MAG: hypothetical protein WDO71_20500 [Bacteroidota bacterium]